MNILRLRAGRVFLLASGVLLTSTVGHAAARLMAAQMALGQSAFAFELAAFIAVMLVAAYAVAFFGQSPKGRPADHRDRAPGN